MKQVLFATGGRPFYDDDLETIQAEATGALAGVLAGLPYNCILSGCSVSGTAAAGYVITAGVVWVGGQVLRFAGASGVTLPCALGVGPVVLLDDRTYQDGNTRTCIQEVSAEVQAAGTLPGVPIHPAGGLTLAHCLRALTLEIGDVKWGRLRAANFDGTGLGKPGTAAWGWGLCNGDAGRIDLRGRFVAGYDPTQTDYAAVGQTGGAETVTLDLSQIPAHAHPLGLRYGQSNSGQNPKNVRTDSRNDGGLGSTDSVGGGLAHENRPPYYVLAAQEWVGF